MSIVKIEIEITRQALTPFLESLEGCGAVVEFSGIVRGEEDGQSIRALEYQAYQPMAELEIERLIRELLTPFPCTSVRVIHRIGVIAVGERAIALQVSSQHRVGAFSFASAFMDRLKQDVPIWKIRAIPK
jgi:molybdopterin synthase catalytic subunit